MSHGLRQARIDGEPMFDTLTRWRDRRTIARHPIDEALWRAALPRCRAACRLGASDQAALRAMATLFLQRKSLEPAQGLPLSDVERVLIATHACLPILKLGLDWYDHWHSLIVYPDAFIPRHLHTDAAGVVHQNGAAHAGEAWYRGPVIVSRADALGDQQPPGRNVIVHEMAHKLDMLNGPADGFPPLHRRMDRQAWTRAFSDAWEALRQVQASGGELPLDPYALTNPAEFLAVASEAFFEAPAQLREQLPAVYQQLALFYRQHPL